MKLEESLLKDCLKDDRRAQYRLYKKSFPVLMGVSVRYSDNHDDAIDLVNRGFLKVTQNLKKYDPTYPYDAWIRRVMINVAIDQFRRNKKYSTVIHATDNQYYLDDNEQFVVLNEGEDNLNAEAINKMIRKLPPMSREVLNLYVVDGYAHKEIAKMLKISEGTSKWHLSAARKKLKPMLEAYYKQNAMTL